MPFDNILNTIHITDTISTSGQPTPEQFQQIADAGYQHIINLAMPDSTNSLLDEGGFVSEAGMNYFHFPVPFDEPTATHLHLFMKLLKILEGEKIWIHCALNYRVSAFMQHYQTQVLKLAETQRVPMIKSWEPDEIWQKFLTIKVEDTSIKS